MCGILGNFGINVVEKSLDILRNRGKDGFGICDEKEVNYSDELSKLKIPKSSNLLAHTLHSIVGDKVNQPFIGKGKLVANCEIYNWKELNKKFSYNARNDAELLFYLLENHSLEEVLEMLDGVYAFAYWKDDVVYIARDIIGEKPLFFAHKDFLAFASENKVLEKALDKELHYKIEELNPRIFLKYNISDNKLERIKRTFFDIIPELADTEDEIIDKLIVMIKDAILKRIPNQKFGILFSGGVDSTLIAYVAKQLGKDFVCYTTALEAGNFTEAEDLKYAKEIAKKYNFPLKIAKLNLEEVEERLKIVCPLIESSHVVKTGVGLTMFAACEKAKEDGIRVIFSGIGSEELFAGYDRHKMTSNVNKECVSGLLKIYERDSYRDDVITMYNDMELRSPFLDIALIKYSLKIPTKFKLDSKESKIILRKAAEKIGLDNKYAFRKKVAAQYGSKIDKAIMKLSKKQKKAEYLRQFYTKENQKLGVLWSGGKDSAFAAFTVKQMNYDLTCLISIKSKNPDSYMFHTPNISLVERQAEAMGIPLVCVETAGEKEIELEDLKTAIKEAKEKHHISGIITGALFSSYQRDRVDKICDELGLKNFCPLWHIDQELEMRGLLKNNFEIIFSSIAAEGLDKSWVGRKISQADVDKLAEINKKVGINIAGEGGEFESLVLDCPLFKKKLVITESELKEESTNVARFIVKKAELKEKN